MRGISEEEMFKAIGTGKKTKVRRLIRYAIISLGHWEVRRLTSHATLQKKSWKRMITKPTFGALLPLQ